MKISLPVILICIVAFFAVSNHVYAQCDVMQGAATSAVGASKNYSYCYSSSTFITPIWTVTNGTLVTSSLSPDGTTAYATVQWGTVGTGTVRIRDGVILETKSVSITCPTIGNATASGVARCGEGSVNLTATPGTNGNTIKWYDAFNVYKAQGTSYSPTVTASTTYYAATFNSTTLCEGSKVAVAVTVNTVPESPSGGGDIDDIIYVSGTAALHMTAGDGGNAVRWYAAETGGSHLYQGSPFNTLTLTQTTSYYVTTYNTTTYCETATRIPVQAIVMPTAFANAIKTEVIRVPGKKTADDLYGLTTTQKTTQFQYLDGLQRPKQMVLLKGSPAGNDIVQPVEFDAFGRASKSYLPYVSGNTGAIHNNYATEQPSFYTAASDKIADSSYPFAETGFENSALGRVTEQGGVDADWQKGGGHTVRIAYSYNTGSTNSELEEVRKFKSDGSSSVFWLPNKLNRVEQTDPQGNKTISFTDASGKVIAVKKQLDEVIGGVTVTYLQTYYVYDDFGRVKYIISPKGVAALRANAWVLSASILKQYVNQFVYDKRGNVIEKKVPGQDWMYFVYDKFNRLVLTQDTLLRVTNKWLFVKYDKKNRPMMQGLYRNTAQTTRSAVQTLADGLYVSDVTYPANTWAEDQGATFHGYTNVSFPKINSNGTTIEVWNVMYYDNYDFDFNGSPDYSYTDPVFGSMLPSGAITPVQGRSYGRSTGSKRVVLGTLTFLSTYIFYDSDGRVIQVRSNNYKNATVDNITSTAYDFEKPLITKKVHKAGSGNSTTVVNTFEYDPQGRTKKIFQSNDGVAAPVMLVQYEYNELSQMVDKKLYNAAGTVLQSVDYRFTVRGQISSINNAQLNVNAAVNDDTNDYFGMEFLYNTLPTGITGTAYYDGSISAVTWKGAGAAAGPIDQKSYKFAYDKAGRLEASTSQVSVNATNWTKEVNAVNENMSYDHNGNILTLSRNQRKHQLTGITASYVSENIDNLTYAYNGSLGDRLLKVEDTSTKPEGFTNGSTATREYTYDGNGNVLTDQNKGISSVIYNVLNKPTQINFTDTRKIDYIYDASGEKLQMKTWLGATLQSTTEYVDGFVYENNVLSFFGSPEGRVVKNGATLEQQFAITDHQGNTRVVFTTATPTAQAVTANYEATTNANVLNYPSGGARNSQELFDHTDVSGSTYTYSQLLNGGVNSQVGVAKSYKVYPGDKVKIEAYAKYYNPSGSTSNLTGFATSLTGAFGLNSGMTGEGALAYQAVNAWGTVVAGGGGQGSTTYPKIFVNILIFDKNHNFLDIAYEQINGGEQVGATPKAAHDYLSREYTVKEPGYAYVYLSNESATYVEAYFDDVVFTYTPTAVVQYNEYYPFGLQAAASWTRENITGNNFLYNAGSELNKNSGWYETFFRGYDAALGRFMQVDPLATMAASKSTFHYAGNDPVNSNDPMGDTERPTPDERTPMWETTGVGLMDPYSFRTQMLSTDSWARSMDATRYLRTNIIINWNEVPDGMTTYVFYNGHPVSSSNTSSADVATDPTVTYTILTGSYRGGYSGEARLWRRGDSEYWYRALQASGVQDRSLTGLADRIFGSDLFHFASGADPNLEAFETSARFLAALGDGNEGQIKEQGIKIVIAVVSSFGVGRLAKLLPAAKIVASWGKAFRYAKGGEMTAIEHIMYRHGANSGFSGVSTFLQGTTARMIKGYADEALQFGRPVLQNDGSYMLRYNVGRTIGTGSNGAATSDIMIYIRDGWIKTAFPIH